MKNRHLQCGLGLWMIVSSSLPERQISFAWGFQNRPSFQSHRCRECCQLNDAVHFLPSLYWLMPYSSWFYFYAANAIHDRVRCVGEVVACQLVSLLEVQ